MNEIREDSKLTTASSKTKPRYAYARAGESPPIRGDQGKKAKKKKRDKSSWRNGGLGAVNPKLARGFLKTTQLNNHSGKRIKIQEIPFFRDSAQRLTAVGKNKKSLKLVQGASLAAVAKKCLTPSAAGLQFYDIDRGKRVGLTPLKAKKESGVPVLLVPCSEPDPAVTCRGVPQLPPTCSPVTQPVVISSASSHPVFSPLQPLERLPEPEIPPLITAVLQRDYQHLERLLKDPTVNVNAQDADGRTALHHAAIQNSLVMASRLLAHPDTNPNVRDTLKGNTGLIEAVRSNNVGLVQLLIDHPKTDPNLPDDLGETPLVLALNGDSKEIVKQLIAHPKIELNVLNKRRLSVCGTNTHLVLKGIDQLSLLKQTMGVSYSEDSASVIQNPLDLHCNFVENALIIS